MEHMTKDGKIDWNSFGCLHADPGLPHVFHHSKNEIKLFSADRDAGIQHVTTLPNIEEDIEARQLVLYAWLKCRSSTFAKKFYRETLWSSMAPFVYVVSHNEDSFQKGMMAVWEEIVKWATHYPVKHTRTNDDPDAPLHFVLDDVVRYLCGVAKNGMRGRKRKSTLIGNNLVEHAEYVQPFEYDVAEVIEQLTTDPTERTILRLKADRLSEEQIGDQVNLSRDQVKRKIQPLYETCCAQYDLCIKPMGRARRQPA